MSVPIAPPNEETVVESSMSNVEQKSWLSRGARLVKEQWAVIVVGAFVSALVSSLISLLLTAGHTVERILVTPENATATITNLDGRRPVVTPETVIDYTVSNLPKGWSTWVAISTGANNLYPEARGTPTPGSNDSFEAIGATVGSPGATLYIVMTDQLGGTGAFEGYFTLQKALAPNERWKYPISDGWNDSPHVVVIGRHAVRPPG
jgi:hypothetical protein